MVAYPDSQVSESTMGKVANGGLPLTRKCHGVWEHVLPCYTMTVFCVQLYLFAIVPVVNKVDALDVTAAPVTKGGEE